MRVDKHKIKKLSQQSNVISDFNSTIQTHTVKSSKPTLTSILSHWRGSNTLKAFTLSEVLISLVIIGIIAAITVPLFYTNYKKEETISRLKKGYSFFNQLILRSQVDNGHISTWDMPEHAYTGNDTEWFKKYFEPYINSTNGYGINSSEKIYHSIYTIDGKVALTLGLWDRLNDGSAFTIFPNLGANYFWIFYDINNSNPPNRLGKDVFMFNINSAGKLDFWGAGGKNETYENQTDNYCCKKGTNKPYAGGACGAWIKVNGWKFPKKYPW